ncbi:hypothetical protein EV182_007844, partial [Spiromyces aspiralis]
MHTHRFRTSHSRSITERGGTTKEWADEHEREAKLLVSEGCIRRDVDEVLGLLRPRNQAVVECASHIAADIAGQLDSLVLSSSEKGVEDILPWIVPPSPHEAEMKKNKNKVKEEEKPEAAVFETERDMYPSIIAFINFVAKKLQHSLPTADRCNSNSLPLSSPTPIPTPPRLICACKKADVKSEGSDGSTRIDIGLVEMSPDETLANVAKSPSYYELFTVLEAKGSVSKENRVFEQLLVYTWQL